MNAVLLAIFVGAQLPIPTGPELAKAEADVEDVFGEAILEAKTPQECSAVARKMLSTVDGSSTAAQYALIVRAKEQAILAGDSKTSILALELLVNNFIPTNSEDPQDIASDGHRLWNEARTSPERSRLAIQVDAAERYLRAIPHLQGFQKAAIERRLRELGWNHYMSPEDVQKTFSLDSSWRVTDNSLVGFAGNIGNHDSITYTRSAIVSNAIEFGFKIRAPSYHVISLQIDGTNYWCSFGHWNNSGVVVNRGREPLLQKRGGPRIDDPAKWYEMTATLRNGRLEFTHGGDPVWSGVIKQTGPYHLRLGFSSHQQKYNIKDVYWY